MSLPFDGIGTESRRLSFAPVTRNVFFTPLTLTTASLSGWPLGRGSSSSVTRLPRMQGFEQREKVNFAVREDWWALGLNSFTETRWRPALSLRGSILMTLLVALVFFLSV